MIRRTEQTVRRRVARIAPTTRVWALIQTRSENSGAKAARMATISGGRSTGVVSRADGLCSTIDRGHAPLDLPVNLAKVEWARCAEKGFLSLTSRSIAASNSFRTQRDPSEFEEINIRTVELFRIPSLIASRTRSPT